MHLAAGQAPQQEAIHSAEEQFAPLGTLTGARHVFQHPAQLGGGEIGVDQQAGAIGHIRFVAGGLERGAIVRGAAVLPDDGRVDGRAGQRIPDQGGLALVGDADGGDIGRVEAALLDGFAADLEGGQPDFLAVVLHPAVLRKILLELLLSTRHRQTLGAEDDGTATGGALVDGEQVLGHGDLSLLAFLLSVSSLPPIPPSLHGGSWAIDQGRPMSAKCPWVWVARVSAESSTSSPRRPALTWMVSKLRALPSMKVRRRFFCPRGLMPPTR
ncbi:hypothetical protein D9M69_327470 [compost metagenome]